MLDFALRTILLANTKKNVTVIYFAMPDDILIFIKSHSFKYDLLFSLSFIFNGKQNKILWLCKLKYYFLMYNN